MTEQETLQENQKLQARLAKAVEVFKEQKADIARLTEERNSEKEKNEKLEARIVELEKITAEKGEQDTQFFEQVQEIENLKAAIVDKDEVIKKTNEDLDVTISNLDELREKYGKLKNETEEMKKKAKEYLGVLETLLH